MITKNYLAGFVDGEGSIAIYSKSSTPKKIMHDDSYATPEWLMDVFSNWFDPCPLNDLPTFDGLCVDWGIKTYCNPPYSEPLKWVQKAIVEMNKGKLIVMLLRADSSTKYFQLCQEYGEVLYFGRRIKFNGKTPYFASMLVIFNGVDKHE
jgi:hypothetical protein